jgi:hypothetical protein
LLHERVSPKLSRAKQLVPTDIPTHTPPGTQVLLKTSSLARPTFAFTAASPAARDLTANCPCLCTLTTADHSNAVISSIKLPRTQGYCGLAATLAIASRRALKFQDLGYFGVVQGKWLINPLSTQYINVPTPPCNPYELNLSRKGRTKKDNLPNDQDEIDMALLMSSLALRIRRSCPHASRQLHLRILREAATISVACTVCLPPSASFALLTANAPHVGSRFVKFGKTRREAERFYPNN